MPIRVLHKSAEVESRLGYACVESKTRPRCGDGHNALEQGFIILEMRVSILAQGEGGANWLSGISPKCLAQQDHTMHAQRGRLQGRYEWRLLKPLVE